MHHGTLKIIVRDNAVAIGTQNCYTGDEMEFQS